MIDLPEIKQNEEDREKYNARIKKLNDMNKEHAADTVQRNEDQKEDEINNATSKAILDSLYKRLAKVQDKLETISPEMPVEDIELCAGQKNAYWSALEGKCITPTETEIIGEIFERDTLEDVSRSSNQQANPDLLNDYKDFQAKGSGPINANDNYTDVPGAEFNWATAIISFIAAIIGGGMMIACLAYCNRDKSSRFEELGQQRIYLEGEDLEATFDAENMNDKKWIKYQ